MPKKTLSIDFQPLRDAVERAKQTSAFGQERKILARFIPPSAVDYAWAWFLAYPFKLTITEPRQSKFGDYRHLKHLQSHEISVNANLNPEAFLVTYLHEVAHMMVVRLYPEPVEPHGHEWKNTFSQILGPVLRPEVFSQTTLPAIVKYARNPKASSASDPELMRALHFNDLYGGGPLKALIEFSPQPGFRFKLQDKVFEVQSKARTTFLCKALQTGKLYKVKFMAPVEPLG